MAKGAKTKKAKALTKLGNASKKKKDAKAKVHPSQTAHELTKLSEYSQEKSPKQLHTEHTKAAKAHAKAAEHAIKEGSGLEKFHQEEAQKHADYAATTKAIHEVAKGDAVKAKLQSKVDKAKASHEKRTTEGRLEHAKRAVDTELGKHAEAKPEGGLKAFASKLLGKVTGKGNTDALLKAEAEHGKGQEANARAGYATAAAALNSTLANAPHDRKALAAAHGEFVKAAKGVSRFLPPEAQAKLGSVMTKHAQYAEKHAAVAAKTEQSGAPQAAAAQAPQGNGEWQEDLHPREGGKFTSK